MTVPARRRAATVATQRAAIPSGSAGVVGSVGTGSAGGAALPVGSTTKA